MHRLTHKKLAPLEQQTLRHAFEKLFPGAEERAEQSCSYTLRVSRPVITIKQYTNGTLYIETDSEKAFAQVQEEIKSIFGKKHSGELPGKTDAPVEPSHNLLPDDVTSWIGSDECGKGDYFGPLVTAAVLVDEETAAQLTALHVRDSKTISDSQIENLAAHIRVICDGKYSIVTTMPPKYNELMEGKSFNHNSARLLGWQHAKAIENIVKDHHQVRYVLIDKFGDEKLVRNSLSDISNRLTFVFRHKAEQNIAVAAASILARQEFIRRLAQLEKETGMELPKGASDIVDKAAKKLVALKCENALRQVAKVHFKTTKKVLSK
ncbi:MAG TPA: ribonuclease HIII [Candidatus Kapabacteria bacterium]|nr:ribonuclease HIII [Candidatus Kapabacteria bacterium]